MIKLMIISINLVGFRLKYIFHNMMFKRNQCKVIKKYEGVLKFKPEADYKSILFLIII